MDMKFTYIATCYQMKIQHSFIKLTLKIENSTQMISAVYPKDNNMKNRRNKRKN